MATPAPMAPDDTSAPVAPRLCNPANALPATTFPKVDCTDAADDPAAIPQGVKPTEVRASEPTDTAAPVMEKIIPMIVVAILQQKIVSALSICVYSLARWLPYSNLYSKLFL